MAAINFYGLRRQKKLLMRSNKRLSGSRLIECAKEGEGAFGLMISLESLRRIIFIALKGRGNRRERSRKSRKEEIHHHHVQFVKMKSDYAVYRALNLWFYIFISCSGQRQL